jgi:hypothetical protein
MSDGEVITGYFPEPRVIHDSRCPNPCPDLDLTSEHDRHCTEWPEPEHCVRCRRYTAIPGERTSG